MSTIFDKFLYYWRHVLLNPKEKPWQTYIAWEEYDLLLVIGALLAKLIAEIVNQNISSVFPNVECTYTSQL